MIVRTKPKSVVAIGQLGQIVLEELGRSVRTTLIPDGAVRKSIVAHDRRESLIASFVQRSAVAIHNDVQVLQPHCVTRLVGCRVGQDSRQGPVNLQSVSVDGVVNGSLLDALGKHPDDSTMILRSEVFP